MKLAISLTVALSFLAAGAIACGGSSKPDATVAVDLKEWTVSPAATSVDAGKIEFVARNNGTMVHELAVLQVTGDGNRRELAEIEDVGAGKQGKFTTTLKVGSYELVCLLVPGEAGSTEDHYKNGMHTAFTVK